MTTAALEKTLDLGIHLEELRRAPADWPDHFEPIADLLWEVDPSDLPDRVRLNLRQMGLEDVFDQWLVAHDRTIPKSFAGGGTRWVFVPAV